MVRKYKNWLFLSFLVGIVCICPAGILAQEKIQSVINLEKISDYYFDADPTLGIEEVSSPEFSSHFSPVGGRPVWTGKHAPASWLKFTIPLDRLGPGYGPESNAEDRAVQWLLLVKPSFSIILDNIEFYVPRSDGGFDRFVLGARIKSAPAEPHSRYYFFSLPAGALRGKPCYLRISSTTDVLMNIELVTASSFVQEQARSFLGYGLLFGIIVAMVIYSIFLLLSLHYRSYIYFIFYNIAIGLWVFYLQGFAKVLFGTTPGLDQMMLWVWAGQFITWGTVFTISFLELRKGSRLLFYILAVAAVAGSLISVAAVAGMDDLTFAVSHYLGLIVAVLVIIAAVLRIKQGYGPARYYLIAWSFLAIGGLVFALMGLKVLPVNVFTSNAMSIGIAFESIFLAMALADRFKYLEIEKKNLEAAQTHFRELSLTDSLTGLRNRRYLMIELAKAMKEARQNGEPLSLIMLDIDDFKVINDRFGHGVGDDMLVSLSHSIRTCTRETDSACLYGGDELVIFMPKVAKQDALRIAERIRTHFETESLRVINGKSLGATISLGIAELEGEDNIDTLLSRADAAMYKAKSRGKNCSAAL
jgi:diguanylate cyclase (GGDEF)-like protein